MAVEAGKTECFFKHVKAKHDLEVGYTVIESNSRFDWLLPPHGSSDMRIGFELRSESDEIIHHEEPMPENQYSQTIENEGDYAICLDNRHSTFGSVLVSLELYVYSQNDMNSKWGDDDWDEEYEFTPEEEYNEMVEELKVRFKL